jgi:small GTP-binding protein
MNIPLQNAFFLSSPIALMTFEGQIPHYKVVVLGNSGCGKTAIITRWISGTFSLTTKPTIGSNHERKRVVLDGKGPVDLYVWDTAGQEQFQSLIPLYARSSCLAIFVTALDDEQSFDAIPTWIDAVTSSCESPPPILLAVNKMDRTGDASKTIDQIHAEFDSRFLSVFFVSALTGEGISPLFNSAAIEASNFSAKVVLPKTKIIGTKNENEEKSCC